VREHRGAIMAFRWVSVSSLVKIEKVCGMNQLPRFMGSFLAVESLEAPLQRSLTRAYANERGTCLSLTTTRLSLCRVKEDPTHREF